jgi:pilus assembly protein FimV
MAPQWSSSTHAGTAAVLDNSDWWLTLAAVLSLLGWASWLFRRGRERRSEPPELPVTVVPPFDSSDDTGWELQANNGLDAPLVDSDSRMPGDAVAATANDLGSSAQQQPKRDDAEVAAVLELAEIMVSFGRARGAEQALEDFVSAHPLVALTPWLKLLELYRQNGQRQDFETLGLRLRRHYNIAAPEWERVGEVFEPLAIVGEEQTASIDQLLPQLPTLGQVARIRCEISRIWGSPECLIYLNKLLRDNRNGERRGFAAGAVRELLLLIDLMESRLVRSV